MKLIARLACSLAVCGGLLWASERDAKALGPIDLEAGLKIGAGTKPNYEPNPFGFGIGGRAGVSLFNLWLGASAMHYFGGSDTLSTGKVEVNTNLLGGEIGYTIGAIPFLQIRPQIGLGDAWFNQSLGSIDKSNSNFYLEPGLTVLIPFGLVFVGADANALIVPGVDTSALAGGAGTSDDKKTLTSFTIHGQIGIRI